MTSWIDWMIRWLSTVIDHLIQQGKCVFHLSFFFFFLSCHYVNFFCIPSFYHYTFNFVIDVCIPYWCGMFRNGCIFSSTSSFFLSFFFFKSLYWFSIIVFHWYCHWHSVRIKKKNKMVYIWLILQNIYVYTYIYMHIHIYSYHLPILLKNSKKWNNINTIL